MSHVRPETYGPRSTTGAVTVLPLYRKVTSVPHGSVRWATPTRSFVSFLPHAVPLPYRPGPNQLMSGSKRQAFFVSEPLAGAGWLARGLPLAAGRAPGSANAVAGPTEVVERDAVSSRAVVTAGAFGSAIVTALSCAGSSGRSGLDVCEPAGAGTATRADAAMRPANATPILVRTGAPSLPEAVKPPRRRRPRRGAC